MDLLKEIERLRAQMGQYTDTLWEVDRNVLIALCNAAESHLQPDLFAVPHQSKSATSREAAEKWRPKARTNGMVMLRAVARKPGFNREMLCKFSGVLNQTAAGRLNVLKEARLIEARGKRKASTGFNQEVYYLTQRGADFLNQVGAENGENVKYEAA
jgi:hypothetical protein